jgi:chromosome segregation ATPase
MRRAFFCIIGLLGMSVHALGQTASSDSQTLQSLLTEVRGLRQDLRISLNRTQSMQILLARLQMQEGAVTRASDRFNDARQKLLDMQLHQKELALECKRLEDEIGAGQNSQQQVDLRDRMKHVQSDLESFGNIVQQQQATETQAEGQLRDEQDKLSAIESQLDELIRSMAAAPAKSQ